MNRNRGPDQSKACRVRELRRAHGDLARRYCDMLACEDPLVCLRSGLVLCGSSGAELTEFLRKALETQMRERGWYTVCVDLALERGINGKEAGDRIHDAIDDACRTLLGDEPDRWKGVLLADKLQEIAVRGGRPLGLLIDSADLLMQTQSGRRAASEIKVARDALCNRDGPPGLPLVLAGSSREGLAELEAHKDSPFFCIYVDRFG